MPQRVLTCGRDDISWPVRRRVGVIRSPITGSIAVDTAVGVVMVNL